MKPLVSIICISYNQEKYIRQTLEGFFKQKVNFAYEIIVHDDASTDGTQKIIQEFIDQNPKVFRPILQTENQYSKTGVQFLTDMYKMAKGKYIAVCEGDDFWTDPTKLQQQVDFLEKNEDYAMVFHPVKIMFEDGEEPDSIFPKTSRQSYFTLENLLKTNYIHTNSMLYRRQEYQDVNAAAMPIDWYFHLYHAQFGKIGFINKTMSVYRKHREGIWWEARAKSDEVWKKHGIAHLVLYAELLKIYGEDPKWSRIIDVHIEGTVEVLSRIDNSTETHLVQSFIDAYPDLDRLILSSLSRVTYKKYRQSEKDAESRRKLEAKLREVSSRVERLELEKNEILSSRAYKVGVTLAKVPRIMRRVI